MRLTFKPQAGQHVRLVRALILVRAGQIEHRGDSLAMAERLLAQHRPELTRVGREQAGKLLRHLRGDQPAELVDVQLDPDARGLPHVHGHDRIPPAAAPARRRSVIVIVVLSSARGWETGCGGRTLPSDLSRPARFRWAAAPRLPGPGGDR
jgi:hypothetical protein